MTTTVESATTTPVAIGAPRGGPDVPTLRKDGWWVEPAITAAILLAFVVYSTWAAFVGKDYYAGADLRRDLISPFYSPCIANSCVPGSHTFGTLPFWNYSPALLILIFPLGFRLTCYYYRKAYYRSFWLSPPACGVADAHGSYSGETRFPLILQNIHRYFFWLLLSSTASSPTTPSSPSASPTSSRGRARASASASAPSSCAPTPSSSGSTRCRATPAGTSAAAR